MCATGAVLNVGEARLRRRKFSAAYRGGYYGFDNVSVCIKSKTVCKRRRSFVNDRVTRPADGFKIIFVQRNHGVIYVSRR